MEQRKWLTGYDDRIQENNIQYLKEHTIDKPVTKTVGTGKDFETLHEAFRWIETLTAVGDGWVELQLDDGTHVLGGEGQLNEWVWAYYVFKDISINIIGASGNKANCIITQDGFDDGDNWGAMFSVSNASMFSKDVTYDFAVGGYPYSHHTDFFYTTLTGSYVRFRDSTIKNMLSVYANGSYINVFNVLIDNLVDGIGCSNSYVDVVNSTITNCSKATYTVGGKIVLSNVTLTTNTANGNIPFNEIQYDGSLITDKSGALSFKV